MGSGPDRQRRHLAGRVMRHGPGKGNVKHRAAVVYIRENRKTARVSLGFMNMLRRSLYMASQPGRNFPVRTLADMSEEEKTALELRYGAKIKA